MENKSLSIKLFLIVYTLPALTLTARFETNAAAHGLKEIFHPLIFGGRAAVPGQFPYQVLLNMNSDEIEIFCGGSIISRNYILTAAHCVEDFVDTPEDISVRAGSVISNEGGVVKGVSEVIVHPQHSFISNDIALLKLDSPLRFSRTIQPVRLGTTQIPDGAHVTISGWGLLPDGTYPKQLQYNTEYALNYEECADEFDFLPPSIRCFEKHAGNGICWGDSGGPAVYGIDLIGVASASLNSCGSNLPDLYMDVISKRNWIFEHIKG